MRRFNYKLGVCPIGKVLFDQDDTLRQKNEVYRKLDEMGIDYVTIEDAVPNGIIREMAHVGPAVASLKDQGADALFIPHCNFGTEGAAGQIARALDLPTLLWAPRDDAPLADGARLRDSLCGCFATGRVLHMMNVKFTYIENCFVDDEPFVKGVDRFVRATRGIKALKNARVGAIGVRVPFFWCTINDEASILKRFGAGVQTFDMVEFLKDVDRTYEKHAASYQKELEEMIWLDHSNIPDEGLLRSLAMRDVMLRLADDYDLSAFAVQFFDSLQEHIGEGAGLGLGLVEDHIACSAETDVTGAFSSVLMEGIAGEASYFPEYVIRHPEHENEVCMWHASAPLSLRHPQSNPVLIKEPWILKGTPATSLQFYLQEGPVTIGRLDGFGENFKLGIGEGENVVGPATREVYTWMRVKDWPGWEKKMIREGFIHHCSGIYGHYADALELAAEIMGIPVVRFDQ